MGKTLGGAAFPLVAEPYQVRHEGMSLRDWFAGMALQGLTARIPPGDLGTVSIQDIGDTAYQLADAMLREREKQASDG